MKIRNKDIKVELGYLRDNLIEGISQGKISVMKDGLEMYEELISTFIDKIKDYGSPYDKARAMQELGAFERGWSEIEWIRNDLEQIIDASIRTENVHILPDILFFPVRLALLAYSEGDYYIFYQFINWVPYSYAESLRIKNIDVQDFIVDRSRDWLREILEFAIEPDIKNCLSEEDIDKKSEFAFAVLLVFNQLLKRSFDKKKLDHFKLFIDSLSSIYDESQQNTITYETEETNLTIQNNKKTPTELELRKKHISFLRTWNMKKGLMLYGIAAWITHFYEMGKLTPDQFKEWYEPIPYSLDLENIWKTYLETRKLEVEHEFGWMLWETESHLDEHAGSWAGLIEFEQFLQLLCCIRSLEAIKKISPDQLKATTIPNSPEILYLAERVDSPFMSILNRIEEQREKWEPIIGKEGMAAIPSLREILKKSVQSQREEDIRVLIAAQLWDKKIEEVKNNILKEWKKTATVRNIIRNFGNYKYIPVPPEGKSYFGINQIDLKEPYVKETRLSTFGLGNQFGRYLADSENKFVIATIISSLPSFIENPIQENEIIDKLNSTLDKLETSGFDPHIFVLKSWPTSKLLEGSKHFRSLKADNGKPRILGLYRNKPIYSLLYIGNPIIVVADIRQIGTWLQYKPKQLFEGEQYINEEFSFLVRPFTEETATELIQKQPDLLKGTNGKIREQKEVLIELQQRVHLRLVEQFEFEITDKKAGYRIPLKR